MSDLRHIARSWFDSRHPAIVVELKSVRGSAPREAGTRMLVDRETAIGSIGGGHLELEAIRLARELLMANADMFEKNYSLGPSLGQCCGGAVKVRWTRLTEMQVADWPDCRSRFHLLLFGAGHVGRSLVRILATLPCTVQWIDEREYEFAAYDQPLPGHIAKCCVSAIGGEVDDAPPRSAYLVMTHSHDLDWEICRSVLTRGDFSYLGLIGSQSKRERFIRRWRERGIADSAVARIDCPIGIEGITGKEPEIVALSAAAQLLLRASAGTRPLA